ncbi:hypothetical protein TRIATDRAFT_254470 [Trichoderma atroviride IMI 206040]|uniref:Uncharacterized protein n=1 Tax=Hypocrea atroviridis (strain ATCC 20476 / IMI 206040) TaxID=452589 RepID=G9NG83_HYPAI|nr:uncharacterized protein TRIATDRAFT_254470 [Trichoderma atroviride IMI 206040]EHK50296.1 hypothetical protein TRIATDRAFT_254470 [Trichoderma atroviride IMI 206040]
MAGLVGSRRLTRVAGQRCSMRGCGLQDTGERPGRYACIDSVQCTWNQRPSANRLSVPLGKA